jgi:hypothetical protein
MASADEYTYTTETTAVVRASEGATTTVSDGRGCEMRFEIRVAYTALNLLEGSVQQVSERKARERITERGFEPGVTEGWLRTTFGWEPFGP